MSIIDDALKGVERAQAETTGNPGGEPSLRVSSSSRLPVIVAIALVLVAGGGLGWWWMGSGTADTQESLVAHLNGSSSVVEPTSRSSSPLLRADNDRLPAALDEEVSALTDQAADAEQPVAEDTAQISVESLTQRDEPQADLSGVSLLTDGSADKNSQAPDVPDFREQAQLQALTETAPSADGEQIEQQTVATLTREGVAEVVSPDANEGASRPQLEESVAGLTEVEIVSTQGEVEAATNNLEVMELTITEQTAAVPAGSARVNVTAEESINSVSALTEVEQESSALAHVEGSTTELGLLTSASESVSEGLPAPEESDAGQPGKSGADSAQSTDPVNTVDVAALTRRAQAAESRGDYSAALAALEPAGGEHPEVVLLRARLAARQGNYAQSLAIYDRVDELALDATASFWLGFTRFNLEQWQPAMAALARAGELDPEDAIAALYLGLAQQQAGDYRGSISAFHRARKLRPDMPEIAFNTGISWWALGEKIRAEGAFRHFMRITDSQQRAYSEQRRRVSRLYLGDS